MEVLTIVFALVLLVGLLCVVGVAAFYALAWVLAFGPVILGIVLGVWLWVAGYDNVGAVVGVLGQLVYSKTWRKKLESSGSSWSWSDGKRATYDREGNITGYVDKD